MECPAISTPAQARSSPRLRSVLNNNIHRCDALGTSVRFDVDGYQKLLEIQGEHVNEVSSFRVSREPTPNASVAKTRGRQPVLILSKGCTRDETRLPRLSARCLARC